MRPTYAAALATMKAAQKVFDEITAKYRAGKIGDAEFLAARKVFKAAEATYDEAFNADVALGEEAEPAEAAPEDTQGTLFPV